MNTKHGQIYKKLKKKYFTNKNTSKNMHCYYRD